MSKHTPTPWFLDDEDDGRQIKVDAYDDPVTVINGGDYRVTAFATSLANAELIVRAVNERADLLAALEGIMGLIDFADDGGSSLQGDNMKEYRQQWEPLARAAIAKAKGAT